MSETENVLANTALPADAVADAMGNLVNVLKQNAMESMEDADAFMRNAEYMRSVMHLRSAWVADLPPGGKEKGKPGRKPRVAGSETASAAAAGEAGGNAAEGTEGAEAGETPADSGSEGEAGSSQSEHAAPKSGRKRGGSNE